MVVDAVILFI